MPRIFAITTTLDSLTLQPGATAKESSFTITNNSDRPLRAQLKVRSQDDTQPDWLSITGEDTREFTAGGTEQVVVSVNIPAGTPPGKYTFRLDAISVANPDEDYTEGPTVNLEVQPTAAPKKSFPWWILAIFAVLLGIGGTLGWMLTRKVVVPDLVTLPRESAVYILESANLSHTEVNQSTRDQPAGTVIDQFPEPEEKVKKNSEIELTIAVAPETTFVPDIKGLSLKVASRKLSEANLSIGNISGKLAETVVSTTPAIGEEVAFGTPINIRMPGRDIVRPIDLTIEYLPVEIQRDIRRNLELNVIPAP